MIRFDGELTGRAKRYFVEKMMKKASVFGFSISLLNIPFWWWFYSGTSTVKYVVPVVLVLCAFFPLLLRVLVPKKSKERGITKKVIIKDDIISIISEEMSIKRAVSKVKKVRDYGEYYELVFSAVDFLTVCVCQKNLLSKGSIKEFEELFADKLIKQDT